MADRPPRAAATGSPDLARAVLAAARQAARRRTQRPPADRAGRPGGAGELDGRPPRGGFSGPAADRLDPVRVGTAVRDLVHDRGWQPALAEAAVFARWPEVVGDEVARHARPELLRDGELVVAAESTAWATQLNLLAGSLLARIRAAVGPDVVRRLRVRGPAAPSWRHGPRRVGGRGPRDTYG